MSKNPHAGHRERMRARFINEGGEGFEDHQLLEMLLFSCVPMKDTNELAHKLLDEFISLSMLIEADPIDIKNRCGVSENIAVFLSGLNELLRRCKRDKWKGRPVLDGSDKSGEFAMALLSDLQYERFYVICLDASSRFIHAVLIGEGTVGEVRVYPRDVVEAALRYKACSVILAHNHPGGRMVPSMSDIDTTITIVKVLNMMNIYVMDHIIVGHNEYISFVQMEMLKNNIVKNSKKEE